MNWKQVVVAVTGCALFGMMLGGLFGYVASKMAPDFCRANLFTDGLDPTGAVVVCGATVGVLLGGGLGCFAIAIQTIWQRKKANQSISP